MTLQEIEAKETEFLIDELEIDEDKIYPDSRLKEDMGIDSLEVVDVVVLADKAFGIKLKPEDFKTIGTLAEFCEFIRDKMEA